MDKVFRQQSFLKEYLFFGAYSGIKIKRDFFIYKKGGALYRFSFFIYYLFFLSNSIKWRVLDDFAFLGLNTKTPGLQIPKALALIFTRGFGVSVKRGTYHIYGYRQSYREFLSLCH